MIDCERLARFVVTRTWDDIAEAARGDLEIRTYGIDVNLFVDHSQIVQLECLRAGLWGTDDTWGRMLSYRSASTDEGR
jgi:hypothetical protein